jgi:hypothetical protein
MRKWHACRILEAFQKRSAGSSNSDNWGHGSKKGNQKFFKMVAPTPITEDTGQKSIFFQNLLNSRTDKKFGLQKVIRKIIIRGRLNKLEFKY